MISLGRIPVTSLLRKAVLAVNPNGRETLSHTAPEADAGTAAPRPPLRFVHASGSHPLAGYTIKRGVGIGGFGEIYYAVSDAGKDVALKLVRQHLEVELRGIRQCLNLKHPNLVALYDIRQDDQGNFWIVMEYVAGQPLQDVIAAAPNGLSVEQALAWMHGMGAGVAYLHDRGIVHRDLKPGNIFSDEGLVKVGDYGLSKFISCSRRSGHTESIGTVHYMAPEVANGRYGKEIDIYALGVIFYELLTGRLPFDGESVGEVLMKHLTAVPDVSMLGEPYRAVIARALEKDPARRFPSVSEILAQLPPPRPDGNVLGANVYSATAVTGAAPTAGPGAVGPHSIAAVFANGFARLGVLAGGLDAARPGDEPVLRTIRQGIRSGRRRLRESTLKTPTKIAIVAVGLFALLATAGFWLPLAMVLLFGYVVYRIARAIVLATGPGPAQPSSSPPPVPPPDRPQTEPGPPPMAARPTHGRGRESAAPALVVKPARQRLAELIASMLASSQVTATMCLVMVILLTYHSHLPPPEQIAWLYTVSLAGTWIVLNTAKIWETSQGEAALRRFISMVLGMGLGVLASGVAAFLTTVPAGLAFLPNDPDFPKAGNYALPSSFYSSDGTPLALAYLAAFGTLFLLIRWWKQADPLRPSRFSLGKIIVAAVLGGVIAAIWQFPQPWLVMIAATISVSVQLSSPWLRPYLRGKR